MRLLASRSVLALALGLALAGCSPTPTPPAAVSAEQVQAESKRLNAWFDEQYAQWMRFSPLMLSFQGSKELNDQLDDVSEAGMDARLAWLENSVKAMEAGFDYRLLDAETQTSWELWKRQYENERDGKAFRQNQYVFDQMNGMQSTLPMLLMNFHSVDSEADYQAYIARLNAMPRFFGQLLDHAQKAQAAGTLPPRFALEAVSAQSRALIAGAPFSNGADSALWADLQRKADALVSNGTIDQARADALKAQARSALLDSVQPAYDRIIAWADTAREQALVNPSGVGTTQADNNGAAYYRHQLKQNTTTELTAEQIHEIGLADVARLRGEMEAIQKKIGVEGDLQAFFAHVAQNPALQYPNTDEGRAAYMADTNAAIDNIRKLLPEYFGLLPKAPLEVRRVEAFREQPGAAQHYYPGTADGSRPGIYYMHMSDMSAMPKTELEVIAYHEALPGHHMQLSIAQELTGLPKFRTQLMLSAYAEGWGLYSERLAKEMPGTYQDPYSDYGRLVSEMWRAIRLVVDTGLHAKGWTEAQAVEYFAQNSSIPRAAMESEVRRYLIMPGQATSYKIGMNKMLELRAKAESALGDKFDIRGFHDTILGGGALPLDLLEKRVDGWIAAQKAA
ncbi:DUF885 domain-containing protein [Stenotrophomonas koreensis]|uniref:DUF885 domain-containing protein n=1 Tax=Stenotrophomonas koreensis TaxID=266128 RepID=UPI003394D657